VTLVDQSTAPWHLVAQLPDQFVAGLLSVQPHDRRPRFQPNAAAATAARRDRADEGFTDDRYACFFALDTWSGYVTSAGFEEVGHYYRPPGLSRHKQLWLATVWRKA